MLTLPGSDATPAHLWQRRAALTLTLISVLVVTAVVPIAGETWAAFPAFISTNQAAITVNDLVTTALLVAAFAEARRPSLLLLGGAYLYTALLVVAHTLSFPGLFGPDGLIGGPQTTAWLWFAWHIPLPLAVTAYAAFAGGPRDVPLPRGSLPVGPVVIAFGLALALAAAVVTLATAGHDRLPVILDGIGYIPGVTRPVLAAPLVLSLLALAVLAVRTRLRGTLDLWLAVAMGAWTVEVLLTAMLPSGRFQAGWYVGRLYGLLASCTVLVSLLLAITALYGRLARGLTGERDAAHAALAESEAELRRLNAGLEERVRAEVAARELAQGRLAHAQRMEALGQLAGGIAHDFNNVMQAVAGGAGLIRRKADDPKVVDHLASLVEEATERGASVTRRLLAFARRGELRAESVNPATLLSNLREMLGYTLGAGVAVHVEACGGDTLSPLLADKGQLETVLVNLATNARDAMPDGGVLTLSAAEERVGEGQGHEAGLVPGSYVRLSVADTGEGMTPAVLARVTEPFFTTKDRGKGTGLGLAMARGFAEQSGGALAIRSSSGAGTTVVLWLPFAAAGALVPAVRTAEPALAGARVLVVDDDALVREVVAAGLEDRGYAVTRAVDAASALAILDAGTAVDLLLTDYAMPGMDGLALIREARRRCPGLPAVLITGNAESGVDEAALALGGVAGGNFSLVRKPVAARALAERVAVLLEEVPEHPGVA